MAAIRSHPTINQPRFGLLFDIFKEITITAVCFSPFHLSRRDNEKLDLRPARVNELRLRNGRNRTVQDEREPAALFFPSVTCSSGQKSRIISHFLVCLHAGVCGKHAGAKISDYLYLQV